MTPDQQFACTRKEAAMATGFPGAAGVRAAMENNRFDIPVAVKTTGGALQLLRTAREASDYLLHSWPGKRTPKHRAALQACHDAIAGDKPSMTARRAFIAAAREADVLGDEAAAHLNRP
jgi:uncharacterized protein DUF982